MAGHGKLSATSQDGTTPGASHNDRKVMEKCPMQVDLPTLTRRGRLGKPPQEEAVALPCPSGFDHQRAEADAMVVANCGCVQVQPLHSAAASQWHTPTRLPNKNAPPHQGSPAAKGL